MPPSLYPAIAPIPAHPVTLTLGCNHTDANQQEEAEAHGEQMGTESRAEMLQQGLGKRHPCKRRRHQDKEVQDMRETREENRATGTYSQVRDEGCFR